jgi:hypothetical protein
MALVLFENNANATLATAIDDVVTTITVNGGQGTNFPAPGASEIFYITLQNYAAQIVEICQVTDRTGDVFTVLRGQDGTVGLSWGTADTAIQLRLTKETLDRFVQVSATVAPTAGSILTLDSQGQLITRTDPVTTDITYESFTATEGQDVFNTVMDLPTTETGILLFINGVRQLPPANFTRTGLNQVTISETLAVGDQLVIGA